MARRRFFRGRRPAVRLVAGGAARRVTAPSLSSPSPSPASTSTSTSAYSVSVVRGVSHERVVQKVGPRQPLARSLVEQTLEEGPELRGHVLRPHDAVADDLLDQRVDGVGVERRLTDEELVEDDAQGPQVDGVVVRLFLDELRRHVQRRSFDAGEHHGVAGHGPGEPKVAELDDASAADEDVLRLHVAVDDAVGVKVVEGSDELPGDGAHLILRQAFVVLQDLEELALRKLGDDAELGFGLERVHHGDDVVVPEPSQDLDLLSQRFDVLVRLAVLRDELHGDDLAGVLSPRLVHLAEGTLADELDDVVVVLDALRAAAGAVALGPVARGHGRRHGVRDVYVLTTTCRGAPPEMRATRPDRRFTRAVSPPGRVSRASGGLTSGASIASLLPCAAPPPRAPLCALVSNDSEPAGPECAAEPARIFSGRGQPTDKTVHSCGSSTVARARRSPRLSESTSPSWPPRAGRPARRS